MTGLELIGAAASCGAAAVSGWFAARARHAMRAAGACRMLCEADREECRRLRDECQAALFGPPAGPPAPPLPMSLLRAAEDVLAVAAEYAAAAREPDAHDYARMVVQREAAVARLRLAVDHYKSISAPDPGPAGMVAGLAELDAIGDE